MRIEEAVKRTGDSCYKMMRIEEAVVYVLANANRGMTAVQIAAEINARGLHRRKDGEPVSEKQVWWVVKNFPDTLTYANGRIMLMI